MANVKFYKLSSIPTFNASIHTGVFIHLTNQTTIDDTTYLPGLWFGGTTGWEMLSNTTDASSVTNIINTIIGNLDAGPVHGVVSSNVSTGSGKILTLKGIVETDGLISQGNGTDTVTIGAGKLKIGVGTTGVPSDLFGANDTGDTVLVLDDTVLHYDPTTHKLGVVTNSNTSANNKIATMDDIASLSGAMHYKGVLNSASDFPSTTPTPGDVYIVATSFTHGGTTYEVGDMVVYGDNGSMNIVQTNETIGVYNGQIAENDGNLTSGNIVVATGSGIATSNYSLSSASSRTKTITDANNPSTNPSSDGVNHSVSIVDTVTIFGQNLEDRLVIGSPNPSIEVKEGISSDVDVSIDLVWNTTMPSN